MNSLPPYERFYYNMESLIMKIKEIINDTIVSTVIDMTFSKLKGLPKEHFISQFISISTSESWKKIKERDEEALIQILVKMFMAYSIPVSNDMINNVFQENKAVFWKYIDSFIKISIHHLHEIGNSALSIPLSKEWSISL